MSLPMLDQFNAMLADRYVVEREVGRGGMASVWLARDLRHERLVAIKILHAELASAIGVDRFLREIGVTARLRHPNIVPVLDSGTITSADGIVLPWYAMAYIPGESLRERLARERLLAVDEALRITEAAAAALQAAHHEGIIHRDIKPENLLLADGRVYVADFGVAKALADTGAERLTMTGLAIGTPAYMSPEQATAEPIDARSDQYALACTLYEMLAGEPPHTGPTPQAVIARRLTEPARAIRPVRSAVPESVEAALLRALERVPVDRFPDVAAFAEALRATAPAPAAQKAARQANRGRTLIGLAVLGAAALAAFWLTARISGRGHDARDAESQALYRRGVQGYDRRTPAGITDAVQSFTAALRRDSSYADAWNGLAKTYIRAYERYFTLPGVERDSLVPLAVAAANRALALDSTDADAWLTLGIVTQQVDPTDLSPAMRAVRRSLAFDSTSAGAWHFLARYLAESGDLESAILAWRRSVAVGPAYTQGLAFLALGHYWRRQFDSAARWADSAVAVDPTYLLARLTSAQIAAERGQASRARAAFEAAQRLGTDVEIANALAGLAMSEARSGRTHDARLALQRAESLSLGYRVAPLHTAVYLAQAYTALGRHGEALRWLQRVAPRGDLHFQLHLRCDPPFDALEGSPAFRALLDTPRPSRTQGC